MESHHAIQVLDVNEDHRYILDREGLRTLLMQERIRDLPVVVVSVAGAYRGGKSFLLNFFIRYLMSPRSAQEDGSWVGEESEPLNGFSWRAGSKRNTKGILLWSEPFILELPNRQKVAVLLMDTQGTFDSKSTVRDNSTIFALSTLLSSTQIYNLSQNIQEDDLQHLLLFTEFGKMTQDHGFKAFQVLEFLVRDWPNSFEYDYGQQGGERLLNERLEVTPNTPKEMKELRENIRSSFENVSCFLMPHPGLKVTKPNFQGAMKDIDVEFREQLIYLTSSLFGPEKLLPKTINGTQVKARDLFVYFETYTSIFNSDVVPSISTIFEETTKAGWLTAVEEARALYETGMESEVGPAQPSVPSQDVVDVHTKYLENARALFNSKRKMGSKTTSQEYLNKLVEELQHRLPQYASSNMAKTQTVMAKAKEDYEASVSAITNGHPICVHPTDLENVHLQALQVATNTFDAARNNISKKKDPEREAFIKSFERQYEMLRLINEQSNNAAAVDQRMQYWQTMEVKCSVGDAPLSDAELRAEHERALAAAIAGFRAMRNKPDHHLHDVYRENLEQAIAKSYNQLRYINRRQNAAAFKVAFKVYEDHITETQANLKKGCLHPKALAVIQENGLCRALLTFRPRKGCAAGFDLTDEDEKALSELIHDRAMEIEKINDNSNRIAVETAVNEYKSYMEDKLSFRFWYLITLGLLYVIIRAKKDQYHKEANTKAYEVFYNHRQKTPYDIGKDKYFDSLVQRIDEAYAAA